MLFARRRVFVDGARRTCCSKRRCNCGGDVGRPVSVSACHAIIVASFASSGRVGVTGMSCERCTNISVDNGGRCDLRVSFVLSMLRFFSRTFDGVIDKNTLSRVARMYSTCQNSQTQHERQILIRNQHVTCQQLQSVDCSSWYLTSKCMLLTVFPPTL